MSTMSDISLDCAGAMAVGPPRRPLAQRLVSTLSRVGRRLARRLAWRTTLSAPAQRDLAAIRSFARFIARYPDMPAAHRDRFVARILHCCETLGDDLS